MKRFCAAGALLVGIATQASAGFVAGFAPANWTQSPGDGQINAFSENGLRITSGDAGFRSYTDVSIVVPFAGRISFDWSYSSGDYVAFYDPFGVSMLSPNYRFIEVYDYQGDLQQSGTFSVSVSAGQLFAFTALSVDGLGGAATTNISNFAFERLPGDIPQGLPEPGTLALMAVALAAARAASTRNDSSGVVQPASAALPAARRTGSHTGENGGA